MPYSRHRSVTRSPRSSRRMNSIRRSTGVLAFQGIPLLGTCPQRCHPCARSDVSPMYPVCTPPCAGETRPIPMPIPIPTPWRSLCRGSLGDRHVVHAAVVTLVQLGDVVVHVDDCLDIEKLRWRRGLDALNLTCGDPSKLHL